MGSEEEGPQETSAAARVTGRPRSRCCWPSARPSERYLMQAHQCVEGLAGRRRHLRVVLLQNQHIKRQLKGHRGPLSKTLAV